MPTIETDDLGVPIVAPRNVGGRPASPDKRRRCGQRKLECSSCGFIARATLSALERCGYPVCGCGRQLELADHADRLAAGEPDAIAGAELEEGLELERLARADQRRLEREASFGFKTGAANCAVCGRFKRRPADVCGYCGDEPATYGLDVAHEREVHNRGAGYRL